MKDVKIIQFDNIIVHVAACCHRGRRDLAFHLQQQFLPCYIADWVRKYRFRDITQNVSSQGVSLRCVPLCVPVTGRELLFARNSHFSRARNFERGFAESAFVSVRSRGRYHPFRGSAFSLMRSCIQRRIRSHVCS